MIPYKSKSVKYLFSDILQYVNKKLRFIFQQHGRLNNFSKFKLETVAATSHVMSGYVYHLLLSSGESYFLTVFTADCLSYTSKNKMCGKSQFPFAILFLCVLKALITCAFHPRVYIFMLKMCKM